MNLTKLAYFALLKWLLLGLSLGCHSQDSVLAWVSQPKSFQQPFYRYYRYYHPSYTLLHITAITVPAFYQQHSRPNQASPPFRKPSASTHNIIALRGVVSITRCSDQRRVEWPLLGPDSASFGPSGAT